MASRKIRKLEPYDEPSKIFVRDSSTATRNNFVLVGEENLCIAGVFAKYSDAIRDFDVRDSDIFVASYPKSGTTWTSEMVWMICNNLDFDGGRTDIFKRVPFLEVSGLNDFHVSYSALNISPPKEEKHLHDSIGYLNDLRGERIIKTHLQFPLLPQQIQDRIRTPKMIYAMRNPKDTCISFFYHAQLVEGYRGNFPDFCKMFLAGKIQYGPYWGNVMGYWKHRDWSNMLIVTYEELKKDLRSVIRKVAKFLDKPLSEDQVILLERHLSFDSMRANAAVNMEDFIKMNSGGKEGENRKFLRSGTTKQWVREMSPEIIGDFDAWARENIACTDFDLYRRNIWE